MILEWTLTYFALYYWSNVFNMFELLTASFSRVFHTPTVTVPATTVSSPVSVATNIVTQVNKTPGYVLEF